MIDPKTPESKLTIEDIKSLQDQGVAYWERIHQETLEDLQFSYATGTDQWTPQALSLRGGRPVETYNIVNGFVRPVVNLAKQNPPAINVFPVSDGASKTNAKLLSGIIRAIEYGCGAQREYCSALEAAVRGGIGILSVTVQRSELTGEAEFVISNIKDPTTVLIDPSALKPDMSDASWVIIKSHMSERQYRKEYPEGTAESVDNIIDVSEMWIKEIRKTGKTNLDGSDAEPELRIIQYVYDDHEILSTTDNYPGKYLPIAVVTGTPYTIAGEAHYQSLTREIKGVQREINFLKSEAIASIACAPKNTYFGDNNALDANELQAWEESATIPRIFLGHKPGASIQQTKPPEIPSAYLESADKNIDIARIITGIYPDPTIQNGLNPVSGKAIKQQQAGQGIATYGFVDSLNYAIKHICEIILDLLPSYWNDDRVRLSRGVDGNYTSVSMGPGQVEDADNFDLAYGQYNVSISTGPSYVSQKDALIEMVMDTIKTDPDAMKVALPWLINQINLPGSEDLSDMFALLLPQNVQQMYAEQKGTSRSPEDKLKAAMLQLQKVADDNKTKGDMIDKLTQALQTESSELQSKRDELAQQKQIADDKNHMQLIITDLKQQHEKELADLRAQVEVFKAASIAKNQQDAAYMRAQELEQIHRNNVDEMLADKATTSDK